MNCLFCQREIKNAGSLSAHQMSCKNNPNRITHRHSEKAGPPIGTEPWNKGKKVGRLAIWDEKFPDKDIFVENSTYPRHSLKERILRKGLIKYECFCCGLGPEWLGKPMPLILDHKNGINDDNRLKNLRFVCSNCDTQLPTHKSKNRKSG